MKKIHILIIAAVISVSLSGDMINAAGKKKTIYYFYAENCESCRRAQNHFKKPEKIRDGSSWAYEDLTIVAYRIVDENNKLVTKNINVLNSKCEAIAKKAGTKEFVYYDRDTYEFYVKKGIPYYRKEGRYSKKDEPFPTPVFIIGDRVILGFNLSLIENAISRL